MGLPYGTTPVAVFDIIAGQLVINWDDLVRDMPVEQVKAMAKFPAFHPVVFDALLDLLVKDHHEDEHGRWWLSPTAHAALRVKFLEQVAQVDMTAHRIRDKRVDTLCEEVVGLSVAKSRLERDGWNKDKEIDRLKGWINYWQYQAERFSGQRFDPMTFAQILVDEELSAPEIPLRSPVAALMAKPVYDEVEEVANDD